MDIVKCSWSGGKDSTCAVHLHLLRGDRVKGVCYIPMFTQDIPLIFKNHYEFILKTADRFRGMGAEIQIVSGMTYYDCVTHICTKGYRKGHLYGFPCPINGKCSFKVYSKLKAINNADVGAFDYEDIGIAYDEVKRQAQLSENKRSILCEEKVTEAMAKSHCIRNELLSPHYDDHNRDGCILCYNAKATERIRWFKEYPQAFPLLMELQEMVKCEMENGIIPHTHTPLRDHKWFIDEDRQLSFFYDPMAVRYIIN